MVILGLVVNAASVPALTRDFLAIKRRHFPARYTSPHALDHILVEVKGSEILQMTRKSSRNPRRQAQRLRAELLDLAEAHGCRIIGRVWVKEPGKGMAPVPSYCYAIQDIARHFSQYLQASSSEGILIADSREQTQNIRVAQSVFTQKWRTGGDPYPFMREVPTFADTQRQPRRTPDRRPPRIHARVSHGSRRIRRPHIKSRPCFGPLRRGPEGLRASYPQPAIPVPRRDRPLAWGPSHQRSGAATIRLRALRPLMRMSDSPWVDCAGSAGLAGPWQPTTPPLNSCALT